MGRHHDLVELEQRRVSCRLLAVHVERRAGTPEKPILRLAGHAGREAAERALLTALWRKRPPELDLERDDFDATPFAERGGLGRFYEVFGEDMDRVLNELNEALAA